MDLPFLPLRALVTMLLVAVAGQVLPHTIWRNLMMRMSRVRPRGRRSMNISPDQIVRAVNIASRFVPSGGNCLVRALTARVLMARLGMPSGLVLGVAKTPAGWLEGHAWLEYQGRVLVGGSVEGYAAFSDIGDRL